jgi:replication initiation and membrane attachment protein
MINQKLFKLHQQSDLSSADLKTLSLLYQPLIGYKAYAMYMTFTQLLNKTNEKAYTHAFVFDLLNIKEATFIKERQKLEAINLLCVFIKDDQLLYNLKAPLTAKQFLTDTILGSYLESEIGEEQTKMIAQLFKIEQPPLEDYENVTKRFDDVFEFKRLGLLNVDHPLEGRQQNGGSSITYAFDYERFVELIPHRLKSSELLSNKFKEQIQKIAYVYHYDIDDMLEIYQQAKSSGQTVNFQQLNFKAQYYYSHKHKKQLFVQEKETSDVTVMQKLSPQVIIQKYAKTDQQGIALHTATSLIERNNIDPGIVNTMLMFVLRNKDGILPNLNYMEKVLFDWLNKGIRTTEDAIMHSQKIQSENEMKQAKKKVKKIDWLDDYIAGLANLEEK